MSNLTERQNQFIDHFVELGNASEAYKLAGYAGDRSNASKLVVKLSAEINKRYQERMALNTGMALSTLERIITDPETHNRDAINAINSYLDRCGVPRASTQKMDVTNSDYTPSQNPDRRYIRNGSQHIIIGNGVMFPCKVPPTEAEAKTPFAYSDPETAKYLQEHGYPDDSPEWDEEFGVYKNH